MQNLKEFRIDCNKKLISKYRFLIYTIKKRKLMTEHRFMEFIIKFMKKHIDKYSILIFLVF